MSPFGPFYPPRLQTVVNHADRLVTLLDREDRAAPPSSWAEAWIAGRSGEIARVVEAVGVDWRRGELNDESAANVLEDYLRSLHEGLAARVGVRAPACCRKARAGEPEPPREAPTTSLDSVERLLGSLECSIS